MNVILDVFVCIYNINVESGQSSRLYIRMARALHMSYLKDMFNSGYLILRILYPSHLAGTNNCEDDTDLHYDVNL